MASTGICLEYGHVLDASEAVCICGTWTAKPLPPRKEFPLKGADLVRVKNKALVKAGGGAVEGDERPKPGDG